MTLHFLEQLHKNNTKLQQKLNLQQNTTCLEQQIYSSPHNFTQPLPAQLSGPYCAGVLAIASMDSHLFGFNLMGILQPRCSIISTLFRHWFIEGNTHFGGEIFFYTI